MINVAIVGSGPAAFYTTEALLERVPEARIDLVERLPTPFGLIRAGVAPDHQSTKKVAQKFEHSVLTERVHFYGNVEVGRDLSLDELRAVYDAVVLAIGAPVDRPLGIRGEQKRGVYGSALIVGWYNGHPDFCNLEPELRTDRAIVIGNGNVALDVARVLVKSEAEMAASDIPGYAADAIRAAGIREVCIVGRRGPADAKFTTAELREVGRLAECFAVVDPNELPDRIDDDDERERRIKEKNISILRDFAEQGDGIDRKRLRFAFYLAPIEILGGNRVEAVRFERMAPVPGGVDRTGTFVVIPCGLVIAAIGYRGGQAEGIPFDPARQLVANVDGRVERYLYAVGWAKRGPTGVIASNRPDGIRCAEQIAEDVTVTGKPGRLALETLLARRGVRWFTFDDWKRIDTEEMARARHPAPRSKLTTLHEMLALVGGTPARPPA
jgi:ferredoxin--NADP+ reductase